MLRPRVDLHHFWQRSRTAVSHARLFCGALPEFPECAEGPTRALGDTTAHSHCPEYGPEQDPSTGFAACRHHGKKSDGTASVIPLHKPAFHGNGQKGSAKAIAPCKQGIHSNGFIGGPSRIRTYDFHRVKIQLKRNSLISEASMALESTQNHPLLRSPCRCVPETTLTY